MGDVLVGREKLFRDASIHGPKLGVVDRDLNLIATWAATNDYFSNRIKKQKSSKFPKPLTVQKQN